MSDPFDLLWPALAAVPGILDEAVFHLEAGAKPVMVSFVEPSQLAFDGVVSAHHYQIEYQTADIAGIKRGSLVDIKSRAFKASALPLPKGDGRFSTLDLEAL